MSPSDIISVRVPATTANLGPGFDCMGMALTLFNEFHLTPNESFGVTVEGESALILPAGRENVIVQAMERVFANAGSQVVPTRFHLRAVNRIPVASGLGSSASAIVGGLLLGNELLSRYEPEKKLSEDALLHMAVDLEGHPDNVVPALLGGAWVCMEAATRHAHVALPVPTNLVFAVGVPNFPLRTEDARKAVPTNVSRKDAVFNIAQASRLTVALCTGDLDLLKIGFGDRLHEPYRQSLIPGFTQVRRAAKRGGAKALTLSGAGPSLLAWCDNDATAVQVADEMTLAWREHNVECTSYVLHPYQRPSEPNVSLC